MPGSGNPAFPTILQSLVGHDDAKAHAILGDIIATDAQAGVSLRCDVQDVADTCSLTAAAE